jgi:hypothetical protein
MVEIGGNLGGALQIRGRLVFGIKDRKDTLVVQARPQPESAILSAAENFLKDKSCVTGPPKGRLNQLRNPPGCGARPEPHEQQNHLLLRG